MRRASIIVLAASLCLPVAAQIVGQLVQVNPATGDISPTGFVATVNSVSSIAAEAEALRAEADANDYAANVASQNVDQVQQIINGIEGIGYIRGYALSFGSGIEADTNTTATIIRFEPAGTTSTTSLWRAYTYFTQDPGSWPLVHYTDSLGRTDAWETAQQVSVSLTNIDLGGTNYECYANVVSMPLDAGSDFFRVFANVTGVGTNTTFMPVRNGISVNGVPGITLHLTSGTNSIHIIGGLHVQ